MRKSVGRVAQFGLSFLGIYVVLFVVLTIALALSLPSWIVGFIAFVALLTFCFRLAFGSSIASRQRSDENL